MEKEIAASHSSSTTTTNKKIPISPSAISKKKEDQAESQSSRIEKLYLDAQTREQKLRSLKETIQREETPKFAPVITSKGSKQSPGRIKGLYEDSKAREEKLKALKEAIEKEEAPKFSPVITARGRSQSPGRVRALYEDAQTREKKLIQMREEYVKSIPFKPMINTNKSPELKEPVWDRLSKKTPLGTDNDRGRTTNRDSISRSKTANETSEGQKKSSSLGPASARILTLYEDSVKREARLEQKRQELSQKEREETPFTPKLAASSRPGSFRMDSSSNKKDPWDRLAKTPTTNKEKLEEIKRKEEEKELAECTFTPNSKARRNSTTTSQTNGDDIWTRLASTPIHHVPTSAVEVPSAVRPPSPRLKPGSDPWERLSKTPIHNITHASGSSTPTTAIAKSSIAASKPIMSSRHESGTPTSFLDRIEAVAASAATSSPKPSLPVSSSS